MEKKTFKISTFKNEYLQSGLQIENARKLPLDATIGNLFKIQDSEVINGKVIYSVQTINSPRMPVGSLLKVSVKDSESVFKQKMAYESLTGTKAYVIRFENLGQWIMGTKTGLREGLSADSAELVNVQLKDVIGIETDNQNQ